MPRKIHRKKAAAVLLLIAFGIGQARSQTSKSPSPARAFLYSFVLPGAGEYACGARRSAAVFFGAELGLWAAFAGFRAYGAWQENDYRTFAVAHAGVSASGKGYDYFADIEDYRSIVDYNDAKLRQRNTDAIYPEHAGYDWAWDSDASRERFERMRVKSDRAYRRSLFVVGGLVLNRLVSGIDAVRAARKRADAGKGGAVRIGVAELPEGGARVVVLKTF